MKENETLLYYPSMDKESGYHIRTYDSHVAFSHRPVFSHKHSDFEISLILKGKGVYHLNDSICEINCGDIFVFGSNQVHCITDVLPKEEMVLFNVQFEPRIFWSPGSNLLSEKYLRLFNGKCERIDPKERTTEKIRELLQELRNETINKEQGYRIRVNACLASVIGQLILDCDIPFDDEPTEEKNQHLFYMEKALNYINDNLSDNLTLADIAAYAGFSRNYFSTIFADLNGLSPWDYITIQRIEMSKNLLCSTSFSVTEIAERCGYRNLANFNRQFKRIVGCSPREFRSNSKK